MTSVNPTWPGRWSRRDRGCRRTAGGGRPAGGEYRERVNPDAGASLPAVRSAGQVDDVPVAEVDAVVVGAVRVSGPEVIAALKGRDLRYLATSGYHNLTVDTRYGRVGIKLIVLHASVGNPLNPKLMEPSHLAPGPASASVAREQPSASRRMRATCYRSNDHGFRYLARISLQPEVVKTLASHDAGPDHVVAWSPNGRSLALGSGKILRVFDLTKDTFYDIRPGERVFGLAWSPDGQLLASGCFGSGVISIWESDSGRLRRHIGEDVEAKETGTARGTPTRIAWSPATQAIAIAKAGGSIDVWDSDTWSLIGHMLHADSFMLSDISWAPDGIQLASAGSGSVQIWDTRTGKLLRNLKEAVRTIAWSVDGQLLASSTSDSAVSLLNPHDGSLLQRLEGHVENVTGICFSQDGSLLASQSRDHTVRIWNPETGAPLTVIRAVANSSVGGGIAFHPSMPRVATLHESRTKVDVWQLDPQQLAATEIDAIRYTTARVVLVGDSGVGKTGLGWRLAHGKFKEHASTHGQQFWKLDELEATRADGVQCEAVLWDLAGQPDYRLVHSLFLDTIDLALLLFDPTNRQEPLAGVDYWLRHLRGGTSEPPAIILVGARVDRGSSTLTEAELAAVCQRLGIRGGYFATSAKDGVGLVELLIRAKSLIPWETMSATVTTTTFKRMRDYILSLKEDATHAGALVSASTLKRRLEATNPQWRFSDAEMITAARHLETHGYVKILRSTGGHQSILLAPDVLSNLASSIVLEARRETHGLGALDEARLLEGDYRLPELDDVDLDERRILLDAVVLLFLEHNICFREYLGNRVLLVFPSLINEQRPLIDDSSIVEDVSYSLSGAVENVYAALVVLLGYTNTFTRTNQWQNQAQYELGDGEVCGFRQIDQGKGAVELTLYYGTATPASVKLLFQGLFETFLTRRDLNIVRYRPVSCPGCGEYQDRAVVIKQVSRGRTFVFCANCGSKVDVPSPDDLTLAVTSSAEVQDQKQVADYRTAFEAAVVNVKSLLLERGHARSKPTCFISYAWGVPEHERWVLQLAKDLRNADIDVLLDRWHSPPGADLGRYIDRILNSQFAIVVGTPKLRQKYETNSADPVIAAELELIGLRLRQPRHYGRTVLPILLQGTAHEAFTPMLEKLVNIDFRNHELYFPQLFVMIWQLCSLPFDHPLLEELQDSMTSVGLSTKLGSA